jgi:F0F1-type ATP synthase epsilon subunit
MAKRLANTGILTVALIGSLLLGCAVRVQAIDRDDKCEKSIHKAEDNLRDAERKHGDHSRQAQQRRRQLDEAREKCHHGHDRDHDHDRH